MQKRILVDYPSPALETTADWLDLEMLADVEVTSEDPAFPVEAALLSHYANGWRAAEPGSQVIRICFKRPQHIHSIRLVFCEPALQRTQEYVLRVSQDNGKVFQDVVRQQWNFSPEGSTSETEQHHMDKDNVSHIELIVTPDILHRKVIASLERLQIA
ncbi:MAG: carbohydrate-binding protein [Gammaproteobacteria bacterium]